ncbi:GNAT family N-acetyltransferase [Jeotgalibacillus proteolyticus]|uniref:GNAT family N-acetyltransferase n=1 Tax=Jeotgalibacillus proteolyticus TaxID=2082395 RepID=A0A2S5GDJ0_9BACL|nr:N-acetyltransferase [Jeotgalibacillus proteolyticus]PPA71107.1 GNAT family N-acetyltransferase [Jeotgalibacillus proteolyticus]
MDIQIKQEQAEHYKATEEVIREAFLYEEYSDKKEHLLVNRIRTSEAFIPELSLVALDQADNIIGHILLSKIAIEGQDQKSDSLALAPVSVLPEYQKKGIGSQLINAALLKAKEAGFQSVIVLGHESYYPKFGFKPARLWNIKPPFEVPDEAFMAIELMEGALENVEGIVQYSEAFLE